jgi:SAM-dependent methyltransferase
MKLVGPRSLASRARQWVIYRTGRMRPGTEADKASDFWARLPDYHLTNDDDPKGFERSTWLATEVLPSLDIESLLEVGTNSGRNLAVIRQHHPELKLRGIDVNPRAIELARSKGLDIDFAVADANDWREGEWDALLTMSVLDHIPDGAVEQLAKSIGTSARYVVAVELWDGDHGTRGRYKYSRDTAALFSRHGFTTHRWEPAQWQYAPERSLLWLYIGERS